VNQVWEIIEDQLKLINQPIDVLLLVGGFSCNDYLFKGVETRFSPHIQAIALPQDAEMATACGAAQYGLVHEPQGGALHVLDNNLITPLLQQIEEKTLKWEHMSVDGLPEEFSNNPRDYLFDVVTSLLVGLCEWCLLPLQGIATGPSITGSKDSSETDSTPGYLHIKRAYPRGYAKTKVQVTNEAVFLAVALQYTLSCAKSL